MSQTLTTTSEQDHLSLSTIMEDTRLEIKPPKRLPLEIYQAIIDHLPKRDLKIARLASKRFAALSEPRLFSKIVLVPSVDCLNNWLVIFDRSDVRRLVHEFVYDDRWISPIARFKTRVSNLLDDEIDATERKRLLDRVDSFNEVYLTSKEDIALEVAMLTPIFRRISHCERVHVQEDQSTSRTLQLHDVPQCITRYFTLDSADISPHSTWPRRSRDTTTRLQGVLLAVFGTRRVIHTLRSTNLTWSNLFVQKASATSKQFKAFSTLMPNLRNLQLLFDGSATALSPERLKNLGRLLRSATNLQWLQVRLHGTPLISEHQISQYEFSSDAPLLLGASGKHVFKALQSVSLDSYVTYEHELVRFVRSHASTLLNLELRNVLLIHRTNESPRGCWVRVIKTFRKILKLHSMTFGGSLTNGGRQLWYVNNPPDGPIQETCLRSRVEKYITHQSDVCPPELLAVAIKPGQQDVDPPTEQHPWVKGDCSWSMTQRVGHTAITLDDILDDGPPTPPPGQPGEIIYLDYADPPQMNHHGHNQMQTNSMYSPPPPIHILPTGGGNYYAPSVNFGSQQPSGGSAIQHFDDEIDDLAEEEEEDTWFVIE